MRDSEIRGKFRSRTIESLYDEAKILVDEYGVKELNIVAQDITRYGIDLYNEYALLKLLDKITSLDVEWVRLLYCYPELLSDDLIKYIVKNDKICKYVDIPLQHIDDTILKTMGRRTSEKEIKNLIEKSETPVTSRFARLSLSVFPVKRMSSFKNFTTSSANIS